MLTPAQLTAKKRKPLKAYSTRPIVWYCRIREKRIALGLKLRDVQKEAGVSIAVMCAIEHGTDPMLTTARKLAQFYGCPIQELWPSRVAKGGRK